jgi:hypothetical protein
MRLNPVGYVSSFDDLSMLNLRHLLVVSGGMVKIRISRLEAGYDSFAALHRTPDDLRPFNASSHS